MLDQRLLEQVPSCRPIRVDLVEVGGHRVDPAATAAFLPSTGLTNTLPVADARATPRPGRRRPGRRRLAARPSPDAEDVAVVVGQKAGKAAIRAAEALVEAQLVLEHRVVLALPAGPSASCTGLDEVLGEGPASLR